jgi:ABC-type multidrug transport system ATPase subunit
VLLTTHYIEEAEELCERVAFIRAGRIVTEGSPAELVEHYGGERLEDAYLSVMLVTALALANRNDHKLLKGTLDSIPIERPEPTAEQPQGISLDRAYDNADSRELVDDYRAHPAHP